MEAQLLRSVKNTAKEKLINSYPEFTKHKSLEIATDPESGNVSVTVQGPHNIFNEVYDAVTTMSDDPGHHKKKALLGLGIAGAGAGAMYAALKNPALRKAFDSTAPATLTGKILAAATPAAIYYMLQNMDRPERAAIGGAVAAGSTAARYMTAPTTMITVPASAQGALMANSLGSAALLHGALFATKHFQRASDIQKLKMIAADKNLSDEEKDHAIRMIIERKDFLTRYPAFRMAPYSERLRTIYNKAHGYELNAPDRNTASLDALRGTPGAKDFIREKLRE